MPRSVPPATPQEKLDWEVEKLRREARNLSRTFITAVVLAIGGAVTAGYTVVKAFTDISDFQKEQQRYRAEIAELTEEKEVATAQLSNFRAAVMDLQNDTALTPSQKLERLQTIEPALQRAAPDQASHSALPARIYLQFLTSEKAYVDNVVSQLQRANFKVRTLGVTGTSRSRVPMVAYYYLEDEQQARALVKLLRDIGVTKVKADPVKLEGSARPRHFDVWLPKSDG